MANHASWVLNADGEQVADAISDYGDDGSEFVYERVVPGTYGAMSSTDVALPVTIGIYGIGEVTHPNFKGTTLITKVNDGGTTGWVELFVGNVISDSNVILA